jgi:hypothetical protein
MNAKILTLAIAMFSLGIVATTATLSNMVYADASTPNDNNPNEFGKSASDLAQSDSGMGDHASDPDDDGTPGNDNQNTDDNNHRSGIGNIGNDLDATCGSKHPADLADVLNGNPC